MRHVNRPCEGPWKRAHEILSIESLRCVCELCCCSIIRVQNEIFQIVQETYICVCRIKPWKNNIGALLPVVKKR